MTPTVDVHAHALVPAAEAAAAGQPGLARQRELDLRGSGAESAAINQAQLTRIGPLLTEPNTLLVKGFYDRPLLDDAGSVTGHGGRVTELVARPLLNLHWPELAGLVQPLAGEWAGRRSWCR